MFNSLTDPAPSDQDHIRVEERHGIARTAMGIASNDDLHLTEKPSGDSHSNTPSQNPIQRI